MGLHRQAVELGLARAGAGGRLDFVAQAERARARGRRAGALFFWLLRERKTLFITQADEGEAAQRAPLSEDERFVVACPRWPRSG